MSGQRVDVKVVMLGKEFVGKTSLVERYVHNRFLNGPYQNTIGAAFVAKLIHVGEKAITLGIWDTAGSERYESMSRIYYRGARAAVVCFDLTDSSSFARAKFWVNEVQSCEEVILGAETSDWFCLLSSLNKQLILAVVQVTLPCWTNK
uniref:Ras-related protein Rab-24-like protein n=1 Tax=Callorhinchus milii TaxID=7868 RepID=V9L127_CALMI